MSQIRDNVLFIIEQGLKEWKKLWGWYSVDWCVLSRFSHVWFFATLWTVAHQASLVSGILQARILEWVVISTSRDLPNPGIEPWSLMSSATAEATWEAPVFSWVTRSYSRRILWRVRQEKENIWCGNLFCSKDFRYLTQINWTPASAYSTDEVSISLYTFPSH